MAYGEMPAEEPSDDHEALKLLRDLRSDSGNYVSDQKSHLMKMCLQEIAEARGDTEAYIAQYSARELKRPDIAAEVAQLLLAEGNADDAMATLTGADLATTDVREALEFCDLISQASTKAAFMSAV